jgi:hypothetical protein
MEISDTSYRYDDFAQCVPGWSSAEPRKAADVCRQMSDFIYDYLIVRPIISDPLNDSFRADECATERRRGTIRPLSHS